MSSVIDLYERLATAEDDKTRARIVAEAFEELENRYPHLSETATRTDLSETELRLTKEIEQLRTEIEKIRTETEKIRGEVQIAIARSHSAWLKWSFLFWITQFCAIVALLWRVWPQG